MKRRDFLKSATGASVAAAAASPTLSRADAQFHGISHSHAVVRPQLPDLLDRDQGTTGEKVSDIQFGGFHLEGNTPAAHRSSAPRPHSTHIRTHHRHRLDYHPRSGSPAAKTFKSLTQTQVSALLDRTREVALRQHRRRSKVARSRVASAY